MDEKEINFLAPKYSCFIDSQLFYHYLATLLLDQDLEEDYETYTFDPFCPGKDWILNLVKIVLKIRSILKEKKEVVILKTICHEKSFIFKMKLRNRKWLRIHWNFFQWSNYTLFCSFEYEGRDIISGPIKILNAPNEYIELKPKEKEVLVNTLCISFDSSIEKIVERIELIQEYKLKHQ